MEETKTQFTHTDGYVAPAKKELKHSDNQSTSRRGFFSDEEEDEDIVAKIHHWKQTSTKGSKTETPPKRLDVHDLFSETKKKRAQLKSDDTVPAAGDIQLNRLMDDYMLGEKGDWIMEQMESLTMDVPPSPVQKFTSQSNLNGGDQKIDTDQHEPLLGLDAMILMEDFEKYIAEN